MRICTNKVKGAQNQVISLSEGMLGELMDPRMHGGDGLMAGRSEGRVDEFMVG